MSDEQSKFETAETYDDCREAILGGLPWVETNIPFLEHFLRRDSVLDFGCGLGRQIGALAPGFVAVDGFDYPNMVKNMKPEQRGAYRNLESDWKAEKEKKYDLIYSCVALQHLKEDDLLTYLRDFAAMSRFLLVRSRWYADLSGINLLRVLDMHGYLIRWDCPMSADAVRADGWHGETHFDALFSLFPAL
jgi:SAM-dependent methyltransferase